MTTPEGTLDGAHVAVSAALGHVLATRYGLPASHNHTGLFLAVLQQRGHEVVPIRREKQR